MTQDIAINLTYINYSYPCQSSNTTKICVDDRTPQGEGRWRGNGWEGDEGGGMVGREMREGEWWRGNGWEGDEGGGMVGREIREGEWWRGMVGREMREGEWLGGR